MESIQFHAKTEIISFGEKTMWIIHVNGFYPICSQGQAVGRDAKRLLAIYTWPIFGNLPTTEIQHKAERLYHFQMKGMCTTDVLIIVASDNIA